MALKILNRPLKITKSFEHIFKSGIAKITVAKKSLLFPIFDLKHNKQIGFYYYGPIGITADFIVHSKKGAIGKIVEETYNNMLIFPGILPFFDEYLREIEPIPDLDGHLEEVTRGLSIKGIDKWEISTETYIFLYKPAFTLWSISSTATLYINPPIIGLRNSEDNLLWLNSKGINFVSASEDNFESYDLKTVTGLLKRVIGTVKALPFINLITHFNDFVE